MRPDWKGNPWLPPFSYQSVEKALHGFFNRRLAKTRFGQPLEMTAGFTAAISAPHPCGAYQPV